MKIGDLEKTSDGRYFLNTTLLPRLATECKNGDEILYIGTDSNWDYKPLFFNPSKLCNFITIDRAERFNPDIVGNIEEMPQVESNRFDLVIMIGIYEFLNNVENAFSELYRVMKPSGKLMVAFPGKGYYPDNRGVAVGGSHAILHLFRVHEAHYIFEGAKEPTSIIVVATKE